MKWSGLNGMRDMIARAKRMFTRPPAAHRPVRKTVPFDPQMVPRTPGAFGNRLKNRRSRYDVTSVVPSLPGELPNIPMWMHDYLVRLAMEAGVKRASHAVRNGWLPAHLQKDAA